MLFEDIFARNVGWSLHKNAHLLDLIGDAGWDFSMEEGRLRFDNGMAFRAEVVGSESDQSDTWLWAWANDASGIPLPLTDAARIAKAHGTTHSILELTTPQLKLSEDLHGYYLSAVVSGLVSANAFYACPHEAGSVFLLIRDDSFPLESAGTEELVLRICSIFPQVVMNFTVSDHALALECYLQSAGLTAEREKKKIVAWKDGRKLLKAKFDGASRLTEISAAL